MSDRLIEAYRHKEELRIEAIVYRINKERRQRQWRNGEIFKDKHPELFASRA